ncbi:MULTISPECIES: hypothetical protein [unclassified Parvimonas]|uniref:hypothetical protein n=1 Tax=unclassified Parvimonas TaxID=1151464 RepID=UPI002B491EC5|nr:MULTISPECIES: hypothetical protein [unclassified Parvimonas]MEB3025812.1 hypothetical protein [Parvimonas sp. M13]MEB3089941.1 hypothetical protein [Parvimonas sp. M20]
MNKLWDFIPIWFFYINPIFWIVIIPITTILCSTVVYISVLYLKIYNPFKMLKKIIVKTTFFCFLCDIMVVGLILLGTMATENLINPKSDFYNWYESLRASIYGKPLDNIFAILTLGVLILLSRIINYKLNKRYTFSKLDIEEENKKKLALAIAIFTAPYIFFFPFYF